MRFVETEKLLSCVHCGLCLSACPTYVELGTEADSPRGRILLMRALEEGRLEPTPEVTRHLDSCLGCRACETACPSGVPYGALIEAARPFVEQHRPLARRGARRALDAAADASGAAAPGARSGAPGRGQALAAHARATRAATWTAYAAALPPARLRAPLPAIVEPEGPPRGTALLLTGCVADALFAHTNAAIARLLARAGVRVLIPPAQGCCGALSLHLGQRERATTLARDVVALAGARRPTGWSRPPPAAARCCASTITPAARRRSRRPRAACARPARAARRARAAGRAARPAAARSRSTILATSRTPRACATQVRDLLRQIPGVRLVELEESDFCCGSAGTYNLTEPAMAARLLERKLGHVVAQRRRRLVAANPGCLLQIRAGAIARGLPVRVEHPADLLAAAHGILV